MARKIAILGGGMAGLTAAFELTRTPALQAKHQVTVYQMGWRLGGKGASSRDDQGRILEHGLHIWYGFYENAFAMVRDVYEKWNRKPNNPLKTWRDAFVAHDFTPFGDEVNGDYVYYPVTWPQREGEPGDGVEQSPWKSLIDLLRLARKVAAHWSATHPVPRPPEPGLPARLLAAYNALRSEASPVPDSGGRFANAAITIEAAIAWAQGVARRASEGMRHPLSGLTEFFRFAHREIQTARFAYYADDLETRVLDQLFEVFVAFTSGVVQDIFVDRRSIEELDAYDFREWLVRHGGNPKVIATSDIVKSLYDTMFQYEDGDSGRPNYAAGTAVQVMLRVVATYKEAVFYLMQTGMGEAVVAPLYQLLRDRGVKFAFFHKVTKLEVSADRRTIARVRLAVQAELKDRHPYHPTTTVNDMVCWPDQPLWDQLESGSHFRDAGIDFESRWSPWKGVREETLRRGREFDEVVLAMALGAFAPLGPGPTPCDELSDASLPFRRMVGHATLVPTQSAQFWLTRTREELGWKRRAATVAGPPPFGIWADMTPILRRESRGKKSRSLQYACGVLDSKLFRRPSTETDVPSRAAALAERNAEEWLERRTRRVWPGAQAGGGFNWDALSDPRGRKGRERRKAQYVRANIDPTECCVASPKGSTVWRLRTDESGFSNLFLAGAWIDTGFNSECVEAAVMSGRQAARAICGSPKTIPGEDFLRGSLGFPIGGGLRAAIRDRLSAILGGGSA